MANRGKTIVHVWHDSSGQIVAVGRVAETGRGTVTAVDQDGLIASEQEVDETLVNELHLTHRIDANSDSLVRVKRPKGA